MLFEVLPCVWDKWKKTKDAFYGHCKRGSKWPYVYVNLGQLPPWTQGSWHHSWSFLKHMVLPCALVFSFPFTLPPLWAALRIYDNVGESREGRIQYGVWGSHLWWYVLWHFFWLSLSSHLNGETGRGGCKWSEACIHFQEKKSWDLSQLQQCSQGRRESICHHQVPTWWEVCQVPYLGIVRVRISGGISRTQMWKWLRWA